MVTLQHFTRYTKDGEPLEFEMVQTFGGVICTINGERVLQTHWLYKRLEPYSYPTPPQQELPL